MQPKPLEILPEPGPNPSQIRPESDTDADPDPDPDPDLDPDPDPFPDPEPVATTLQENDGEEYQRSAEFVRRFIVGLLIATLGT